MKLTPNVIVTMITLLGINVTFGSPTPQDNSGQGTDIVLPSICIRSLCAPVQDQVDCPEGWNVDQLCGCWTCCQFIPMQGGLLSTTGSSTGGTTGGEGSTGSANGGMQ